MKQPQIWWQSSRWWAWFGLAAVLIGFALKSIAPNPFWWQRWLGEQIIAQGSIPGLAQGGGAAGTPIVYQDWGGAVLLAWLTEQGGLVLVHLLRSIMAGLTLWLIMRHAWLRGKNWRAAAIAVVLTGSCAVAVLDVSADMLVWPLLALSHLILTQVTLERWSRRTLLLVPLLALIWANLAMGVGALLLLALAFAAGAQIDRHYDRTDAPTYPTLQALWRTAAATTLIILLNPRGWQIIEAMRNELLAPFQHGQESRWASLLLSLGQSSSQILLLWLIVSIALVLVIYNRLRSADLLALGVLALLTLLARTFGGWFAVVAGPILAEAIMRRGRLKITKRTEERNALAIGLAGLAAVLALAWQPLWGGALPSLASAPSNTPFERADLVGPETALGAFEFLAQERPDSVVFSGGAQSSYGLWRAASTLKLPNDPRLGAYTAQHMADMRSIAQGEKLDTLLPQYAITTILVTGQDTDLLEQIRALPAWQAVYTDSASIVFEHSQ